MRTLALLNVKAEQAAWVGWTLFVMMALLFYRLWTSTRNQELEKMKAELAKARTTISELRGLEAKLKARNEELSTAHHRLHTEYTDLKGRFSQLEVAYGRLGEMVRDLRADLKAEQEKRDAQYMELMRLKARNGDL